MKNKYRFYYNNKATTLFSNIGMWMMLAFDIFYLIYSLMSGFLTPIFVIMIIAFVGELFLIAALFPKPILHLRFTKASLPFYIVFAINPLLIFIYAMNITGALLAFLLICFFSRIAIYLLGFILVRLPYVSAIMGILLCAVFGVGTIGLIAIPSSMGIDLGERPVNYMAIEDGNENYYCIDKVFAGFRNNINLKSELDGLQVKAVGRNAIRDNNLKQLSLPESIEVIEIDAIECGKLTELNIKSDNLLIRQNGIHALNLQKMTFDCNELVIKSGGILAENMETLEFAENMKIKLSPSAFSASQLKRIIYRDKVTRPNINFSHFTLFEYDLIFEVDRGMVDELRKDKVKDFHKNYVPIVNSNEYYTIYNGRYDGEGGGDLNVYFNCFIGTKGERLTLPRLEDNDFEFIGWFDSESCENPINENNLQEYENKQLYIKYLEKYLLTFNGNGGEIMSEVPAYYTYESNITLPSCTKQGYTFVGWFDMRDEIIKANSKKAIYPGKMGDTIYIAIYKINLDIVYNMDGGTCIENMPAFYHEWGDDFALPSCTKEGYSFLGWQATYSDGSSAAASNLTTFKPEQFSGAVTLTAKFNLNYSITYNLSGGTITGSAPVYYHMGISVTLPTNVTKTGYNFMGWFSDAQYKNPVNSISSGSTGNKEFFAKWEEVEYKLYFNANGGNGMMFATILKYTQSYKLPECTFNRAGYKFIGWEINGKKYNVGDSVKGLTTVNDTLSVFALWEKV